MLTQTFDDDSDAPPAGSVAFPRTATEIMNGSHSGTGVSFREKSTLPATFSFQTESDTSGTITGNLDGTMHLQNSMGGGTVTKILEEAATQDDLSPGNGNASTTVGSPSPQKENTGTFFLTRIESEGKVGAGASVPFYMQQARDFQYIKRRFNLEERQGWNKNLHTIVRSHRYPLNKSKFDERVRRYGLLKTLSMPNLHHRGKMPTENTRRSLKEDDDFATRMKNMQPLPLEHRVGDILEALYPINDHKKRREMDKRRSTRRRGIRLAPEEDEEEDRNKGGPKRQTAMGVRRESKPKPKSRASLLSAGFTHRKIQEASQEPITLQEFRQRLLTKFGSIDAAFHILETSNDRSLTMKEWFLELRKHNLCAPGEARTLFNIFDADKSGFITFTEFYRAMERCSPVTNLDDMRRRMICLHGSVPKALKLLEAEFGSDKRFRLRKFAAVMEHYAGVETPEESKMVFDIVDVCDHGYITFDEFACGMASVSPYAILEELKDRVVDRFGCTQSSFQNSVNVF